MTAALVITHVVDIEYIAVYDAQRHAPITRHPYGPMAYTRSTKRLRSEAGQCDVLG